MISKLSFKNSSNKFCGIKKESDISILEFADLLGCNEDDFDDDVRQYIANTNFKYRKLSKQERETIIVDSLNKIDSADLSQSGPHKQVIWEKGWSENLSEFVQNDFDMKSLVPKFVRQNAVKRLRGEYITPSNPDFESAFVNVMRKVLFKKYFSSSTSVFEFGCGTGLSLAAITELFPDKKLYGLDWSVSSGEIIKRMSQEKKLNIEPILFDMYNPDYSVEVTSDDAIFTIGALEQLGRNFHPFLEFILHKRPKICINFETMNELYNQKTLPDYISIKYTKKRNYLWGYLETLRKLEDEKRIKILKTQRTFGTQYHEGYSFVIWKPLV